MRYAYAALLVVAVIGAGAWWFADRAPTSEEAFSATDSATPPRAEAPAMVGGGTAEAKATPVSFTPSNSASAVRADFRLETRLEAMRQRRHGYSFRAEDVAAAVARDNAWAPVDQGHKSLPLKPEEFTDGRQFITLDPLKIESLMPGDAFTVMLDKSGKQYRVEIDAVDVHDGGRISWHGHLAGLGDRYNVTFTRGESLTVGGLETPDGHYVLQAHGANGWIASSQLLFKIDPNETDAIVPPTDTHN